MSNASPLTSDPSRRSWVDAANDPACDFPLQNLPLGVFSRSGDDEPPRLGAAIGDRILDLNACEESGLLSALPAETRCVLHAEALNDLMGQGRAACRALREELFALLSAEAGSPLEADGDLQRRLLVPMADATMHRPARIGDYTDFYASIHHATNVGSMFRPDNPLLPNYKHLPVGYHGRASSIVVSGTPIRRPMGQIQPDETKPPIFGPCRLLDYEMEMGVFVGPGNELGSRIAMPDAAAHLFGMVIVNDWSARDVQKWEYQPLGPFNAKNFATTISPWVVTMDALEPYRVPGPSRAADDPPVLDYLRPTEDMGFDITVEVWLRGAGVGDPVLVSRGAFRDMYWTIAQMLVHHTSTGCNLMPGDLLASGTISGSAEDSRGCLLERTWRGTKPIRLADGTERRFLQDGDEVIMQAYCLRDGAARIGFGECRGIITPATP